MKQKTSTLLFSANFKFTKDFLQKLYRTAFFGFPKMNRVSMILFRFVLVPYLSFYASLNLYLADIFSVNYIFPTALLIYVLIFIAWLVQLRKVSSYATTRFEGAEKRFELYSDRVALIDLEEDSRFVILKKDLAKVSENRDMIFFRKKAANIYSVPTNIFTEEQKKLIFDFAERTN